MAEDGFRYCEISAGRVQIFWCGAVVTTLAGRDAAKFLTRVETLNADGAQQLMARATGHFRHGTERSDAGGRGP